MQEDIIFKIIVVSVGMGVCLIFTVIILLFSFSRKLLQKQTELFKAVVETQESERERIGRDLHDNLGPLMAGIRTQWEAQRDHSKHEGIDLSNLIKEATQGIREAAHELVPYSLERYGLVEATDELAQLLNNSSTSYHIECKGQEYKIAKTAMLNIFRILQELLNNCSKHSEAKRALIEIVFEEESLRIFYKDDGKGFDMKTGSDGIGLKNIRSRVSLLGGKLNIKSQVDQGTIANLAFSKKKLLS